MGLTDILSNDAFSYRKDQLLTVGGFIAGAVTPIIATKYLIGGGVSGDNWQRELAEWTGALALNIIPTPPLKLPVPAYTGMVGFGIGSLIALYTTRSTTEQHVK